MVTAVNQPASDHDIRAIDLNAFDSVAHNPDFSFSVIDA
jgi:hypothetical protein